MKIKKEKSVVLSLRPLSDFDGIVTLFGEETGLFRAVIRGIRRPKSRLCGIVQPFSEVISEWIPSRSENNLARYIRAECITHPPLSSDPILLFLAEIAEKGTLEHSPDAQLYEMFRSVSVMRFPERLSGIFIVRLLSASGLLPSFSVCPHTKERHQKEGQWREDGAIVSSLFPGEAGIALSFSEIKTLCYWQEASLSISERIILSKESEQRLLHFLLTLLEHRHGIRLSSKILLGL